MKKLLPPGQTYRDKGNLHPNLATRQRQQRLRKPRHQYNYALVSSFCAAERDLEVIACAEVWLLGREWEHGVKEQLVWSFRGDGNF